MGKLSIIVVSAGVDLWDKLTIPALESLRRYATRDHEFIVVDNGGLGRGDVNTEVMVPYGHAVNHSAESATGDRLLILNNDIVAHGPYMDALGTHTLEGPTPRTVEGPTHYLEGWALSIDRALWDILGGFDTYYRNSWEDVDLCWRARCLGFTANVIHDWPVRHYYGQTRIVTEGANANDFANMDYFYNKKRRAKWTFTIASAT